MKSYASIDRIEGEYAVCEVEMVEIANSNTSDFSKETEIMNIPLEIVKECIKEEPEEGDIIIVEHNREYISSVYAKDEQEKQKRIEELMAMNWSNK